MKRCHFPKTIFCLALLFCWGSCAPPATAQSPEPWRELVILAPLQKVEVHTTRRPNTTVFVCQHSATLSPNGAARGFLTLFPTTGHTGGVNMIFIDGSVRFLRDGTVARVMLRGRTSEGHPIIVFITPAAMEDCHIYTTIGTDVHATWEAHGRLTVIR